MALFSITDLSGSNGQQNFAFSFGYLSQEHVFVYSDTVLISPTAYTFVNAQTIQFTTPLSGPHTIRIQRLTPKNVPAVNFTNGSVLGEGDLDNNTLQLLYLVQEAADYAISTLGVISLATNFQWDALGKKIINVADPSNPQDVVSKSYADTQSGTAAQAAAVAAAQAQATAALQVKNDILALPLANVSTFIQSLLDDADSATARQTLQIPTASEVWSNKNLSGAVATADPVVPLGLATKQYTDRMAALAAMLF
jgi:hypothetical protein